MEQENASRQSRKTILAIFLPSTIILFGALVVALRLYRMIPDLSRAYIFYYQYIVHEIPGSILAILILTGALFLAFPKGYVVASVNYLARRRLLVSVIVTVLLAVGCLTAYHNLPLTIDEFAPYFQSQAFAAGRLTGEIPARLIRLSVPFVGKWFYADFETGRVMSAYWPGFALLLTPFQWLGMPWLLNPLLAGTALLLMFKLGRDVLGSDTAGGWAMLFMLASPVFLILGLSYYSMTAHMVFNLAFATLLFKPTKQRLFWAGVVGSVALSLHNPFPHFLFAMPFITWLAIRPRRIRNVGMLALGYLPLTLLIVGGYFYMRGQLTAAALAKEAAAAPESFNLRISLNRLAPGSINLPDLKILFWRLLGFMKLNTWAMPGLMILATIGAWGWRRNRFMSVLALSALLTFFGYFFGKVSQGHGWGYRYFHSAFFTLPLFAAAAIQYFEQKSPKETAVQLVRYAGTIAVASLVLMTALRVYEVDRFISRHLQQRPPVDAGKPQVAFIRLPGYYAIDLVQNDPFLRGNTLYLKSSGPEFEKQVMKRFFRGAERRDRFEDDPVWNLEPDVKPPE